MRPKLKWTLLAAVGYLLSPLSWWNDAFVNIPIAYLLAVPFSLIGDHLFLPALIFCYWLTNLLGLLLLRKGLSRVSGQHNPSEKPFRLVLVALLYTAVLAYLATAGILKAPWQYFK